MAESRHARVLSHVTKRHAGPCWFLHLLEFWSLQLHQDVLQLGIVLAEMLNAKVVFNWKLVWRSLSHRFNLILVNLCLLIN
jgi:hypothetical protein